MPALMMSRLFKAMARPRGLLLMAALALMLVLGANVFASPAPVAAARFQTADFTIQSITRSPNQTTYNQNDLVNIIIELRNVGAAAAAQSTVTLSTDLTNKGFEFVSMISSTPGNLYSCFLNTNTVLCPNLLGPVPATSLETIIFRVRAASFVTNTTLTSSVSAPSDPTTNPGNTFTESQAYSINAPTITPTITLTPTISLTPLPSLTLVPTATFTSTATFIPAPPTRTPFPRPPNAGQSFPIPPSGVDIVVNRDGVNVRISPAIGAELVATVNAATVFEDVQARTADGEWLRVTLLGEQGWIGTAVVTLLAGDINALPVADPRTVPYGGFENPRAGLTEVTSPTTVRLVNSGVRLRAGPSIAYPVLANPPRYSVMPVLGRVDGNTWLQVNFEGTLGWIRFFPDVMEFSSQAAFETPLDGIIADAVPFSDNTFDSYVDTLRLMLARLDIAGQALTEIRTIWTNAALGQPIQCGAYPIQPSNISIPNSLLSTFNPQLFPLQEDFNSIMTNIREAVRLLIESCSFAQPAAGSVGEGTIALALGQVNEADALFGIVRANIIALLPPDRPVGENECVFQFETRVQILPRLVNLTPVVVPLDSNERVLGFCFDGTAGQTFRLEALRVRGNIAPTFSISAFNNPTSFFANGSLNRDVDYFSLPQILIPETGQYLLIISDTSNPDLGLEGDLALMLTDLTLFAGAVGQGIALDANGNVITNPNIGAPVITPVPGATVTPFGQAPQGPTPTLEPTEPF